MSQRRFAAVAAALALLLPAAAIPAVADPATGGDSAVELDAYRVQIDKKVKDSDEYLAGASLEIRDEDGETVTTFVSKDGPVYVELAEGDYTLVETEAPEGYEIAEPVEFTVVAPEVYPDETIGEEYSGRTFATREYRYNYEIRNGLGDGENEVVYCLNSKKHSPRNASGILDYVKYDGTAAALAKATAVNTPDGDDALSDAELRSAIMKALYVGFPNDAEGIQEELGLSNDVFRKVTQYAVWSLANNRDYLQYIGGAAPREAYKRLLSEDVELPATLEAHIYVAKDDVAEYYQSLVGTRFGEIQPPIVVTMEDAKATVTRGEDLPSPTPTPEETPTTPTFIETTPAVEETTPAPTPEEETPTPVARGEELPAPVPSAETTVPAPEQTSPAPTATVALPNTGVTPLQNTGAAAGLSVFMVFLLIAGGTSAYAVAHRKKA